MNRFYIGISYQIFLAVQAEFRQFLKSYLFRRPLLLFFMVYLLLILVWGAWGPLFSWGPQNPAHWAGKRVQLTGIVSGLPDPRPRGTVVTINSETLRPFKNKGDMVSVSGLVLVHAGKINPHDIFPGDRILVRGTISLPQASRIPGTFDYQAFLKTRGIHSIIYTSSRAVSNLGATERYSFLRWGWKMHLKTKDVFYKLLSEEQAAVLSGLVIGARPRFHPELRRIFVETGTMHILVASGSNVAFVVLLWILAGRVLFRFNRTWSLLTSLPAIWIYVLMVGGDPPILRAGVMTTVGIISYLLAREDRAYHALALAALAILIPHPGTLFEVGFQMSFVTVFGMVYFLPKIDRWMSPLHGSRRWLLRLGAATLTAQIWITPILIAVFNRFFPIGFLANLFVIPLAAGGLAAGLLLVGVDWIHSHLFSLGWVVAAAAYLVRGYVQSIISLVRYVADHHSFSVWLSPPGWAWVAGFYLILFCLPGIRKWTFPKIGLSVGVLLTLVTWTRWIFPPSPPSQLQLTWVDLGRTQSLFIQTPENKNILIHPGPLEPTNAVERIILPYLAHHGIKRLDAVIMTQSPVERVSGIFDLVKDLRVNEIVAVPHLDGLESLSVIKLPAGQSRTWGPLKVTAIPGSKSFRTETPLWVEYFDEKFLLGHVISLTTQRYIIQNFLGPLSLIQARFSERLKWDSRFVHQFQPQHLVETGYDSPAHPSRPPWEAPVLHFPQKEGIIQLSISLNSPTFSSINPIEQK